MTFEMGLTFAILGGALVVFMLDVVAIDFVAFSIMALILALGPVHGVEPREAISGFSNPATITILAMFILSAGIYRTGLINRLARIMIRFAGDSTVKQLLVILLVVGPISAFINNTAAVAILIPSVITMARQHRIAPSKLLIPLSYFSQLGGAITLIGTSTNILASSLSAENGYAPFGMFEFSRIGLLICATGAFYMLALGRKLLPTRRPAGKIADDYQLGDYVTEVVVLPNSPLVGRNVIESDLGRKHRTHVLEIYRDGRKIAAPVMEETLRAGDTLVIQTATRDFLGLEKTAGLGLPEIASQGPGTRGLMSGEQGLIEVVIGPTSDLIGGTPRSTNFHAQYNCTIIAIRHHGEIVRDRLSRFRFGFGDTLLLRGSPRALEQIKRVPTFISVTEEVEEETFRSEKTWVALGIIAGVVLLAALGRPILVTAIVGSVLMVVTGCLKVNELHESIRWDVIFLLAGIIPLGIAMQRTGCARFLADFVTHSTDHAPPLVILMVFYLITIFLAETISHSAAVVVMIPVGISTAETLGLDARAFVLACMFAAAMSFSTPVGYQTNTMIYGPGGYKFLDFTRVGAPLSLLMAITVPIYIYFFWGL